MDASDISWQMLRRIVKDFHGNATELAEVVPLVGGRVNTTLALTMKDGFKAVLKISPHRVNLGYEREAYELNLLRELGLPAPEVYCWKIGSLDDPHSFLLMQFIVGFNLSDSRQRCAPGQFDQLQDHLAQLLLRLHAKTAYKYMRLDANQRTQAESWPEFYYQLFDPIWRETEKQPFMPPKCRKLINKVHEKLDQWLIHDDQPRLIHGDLWSTNLLCRPDDAGQWRVAAVLDPNCRYAHCEMELAYLELFQTVNDKFLKVYQQTRKLPAEYHQRRKWIYQLYELINHVHFFGPEYLKPLMEMVQKVSALK